MGFGALQAVDDAAGAINEGVDQAAESISEGIDQAREYVEEPTKAVEDATQVRNTIPAFKRNSCQCAQIVSDIRDSAFGHSEVAAPTLTTYDACAGCRERCCQHSRRAQGRRALHRAGGRGRSRRCRGHSPRRPLAE